MAITNAATLVRKYCKPITSDTTNWPNATLEGYWDTAHERLKQKLCPPFSESAIEALNFDATNSDSGDDLIARMAALLIYEALPGSGGQAYQNLYRDMFGGTAENGTDQITGQIELLQTGQDSLFDADGNRLSRAAAVYHTHENSARKFSQTRRDLDGNIVGSVGTLDQFDKL